MAGDESTVRPQGDPASVAEEPAMEGGGPPGDDDQRQQLSLQHARGSLAAAVAEGRMAQADADTVLERLARGEDAHRVRRELRRAGVVLARAPRAGADVAGPGLAGPPQGGSAAGAPRWVKGLAIVAGLLVLLIVILLLASDHGPGRHPQGSGQSLAFGQLPSIAVAYALRP